MSSSDTQKQSWIESYFSAELRHRSPYAPKETTFLRLDANEAPSLVPTLTNDEHALWNETLLKFEPSSYPDAKSASLREVLAHEVAHSPSNIVVGVGSDECISMLLTALRVSNAQASIMVCDPTFVMYEHTAQLLGIHVHKVPLQPDGDLDIEHFIHRMKTDCPSMIFLATPNNPTSRCYTRSKVREVLEISQQLSRIPMVVVDEAYVMFRRDESRGQEFHGWHHSYATEWLHEFSNLVVLRTLSKVGLAGLRIGWIVAQTPLAQLLQSVRLPYNITTLSQALGALALGPLRSALARHVTNIKLARTVLHDALQKKRSLQVGDADGNFFWIQTQQSVSEIFKHFEQHQILVRAFPQYANALRMSIPIGDSLTQTRNCIETIPEE